MAKMIFPKQFERSFKSPLDIDSLVDNISDLDTLKNKATTYPTMLVGCKEDNNIYKFNENTGEFEILGSSASKVIVSAIAVDSIDTTLDNYQYLLTDYTIHKIINGIDTDVTNNVYIDRIEIEQSKYEALPDTEKDKDYVWYVY